MNDRPSLIYTDRPGALPAAYTFGPTERVRLTSVSATFDGSGAASAFLPCLALYSQDGHLIGRWFPSQQLSVGDSGEVTYGPFLGGSGGSGSSGGGLVPVTLDTPNQGSTAYPALTTNQGFTVARRLRPAFQASQDSSWQGAIRVPDDYVSTGTIVLSGTANATTGNVRLRVSTSVVAAAASLNAAMTAEAYVNHTVPGTALARDDISFVLTTAPAAGATLNVKVERNGANVADTLAADWMLWECLFTYVTA